MKLLHPRYLLLWVLALLPIAAMVWYLGGPFLLTRTVEVPLVAKNAARLAPENGERNQPASVRDPAQAWSLEWVNSAGETLNGRWLDLVPQDNGNLEETINVSVPNYEFDALVLAWHAMPDLAVQEPQPATLVEWVGRLETRTELKPRVEYPQGVSAENGMLRSEGADGAMSWQMPTFTVAQVQDILAVYGLLLAGLLVPWVAYHVGDGRRWYTPQRAALLVIVLVHAWLALRAPLMYCPDSMDYAVNAKLLLDHRTFDHFNAWRLPGYSVFLTPFVGGLQGFNFGLGLAQAVLAVLTAWLAGRAVLSFLKPAWAALAMLVVGLDPVLLLYERHAMPECLAAFLAMLAVWCALKQRFWVEGGWAGVIAAALGMGLLLGASCYVRGNLLIVAAVLPFAIASWPLAARLRGRAAVILAIVLLTAVGTIVPWIINNHRRYERAQFVVGAGFTRAFSAIEAGILDLNQSGAFTHEQWESMPKQGPKPPWTQTMTQIQAMQGSEIARRTESLPDWTKQDERCSAVVRESNARDPRSRWVHSLRALINLLGLWPASEQESNFWSTELRTYAKVASNHRVGPNDFGHLPKDVVNDIFARTQVDISSWTRSDEAHVYDAMWRFAQTLRPLWAALVLVGVIGALGRRHWALFIIGGMVLAHAGYLSVVLLTGIDRYQAPLYPVMTVLVVYGLACLAGAAPMVQAVVSNGRAQDPSSRTTRFR